ncbi:uncharacterized protein LOC113469291 [Diaphorina citri]|uniref:Uncharacterized protein LOC113469291 n=1 Tax=Diaphorina citri TaxID=121845 RepID=A0A3Q0J6S8_DIACI|nr:uncharacterized protein LOC113469291 [Diaphorina citri]
MRQLKDLKTSSPVVKRSLWLLSTSRNALVVMLCSALGYYLHSLGEQPFILTGDVRPGLPPFQFPPFSTSLNNQTLSFLDMCTELGSSIVMVPVIAVLGNVSTLENPRSYNVMDEEGHEYRRNRVHISPLPQCSQHQDSQSPGGSTPGTPMTPRDLESPGTPTTPRNLASPESPITPRNPSILESPTSSEAYGTPTVSPEMQVPRRTTRVIRRTRRLIEEM